MKPDGSVFHGLGKRCAACKRREPPLFGGGGTTGWPRATVGCGLSSWAHYASSTSATRPRASSPARCDCVIKQSPNPRGTICRASPSPPSALCFRIRVSAWDTCVRACVYVRARDCTYVKIDLEFFSSSFLPSFLPSFPFFSSGFQFGNEGGKINLDYYHTRSSRFLEEISPTWIFILHHGVRSERKKKLIEGSYIRFGENTREFS